MARGSESALFSALSYIAQAAASPRPFLWRWVILPVFCKPSLRSTLSDAGLSVKWLAMSLMSPMVFAIWITARRINRITEDVTRAVILYQVSLIRTHGPIDVDQ